MTHCRTGACLDVLLRRVRRSWLLQPQPPLPLLLQALP